MPEDRGGAAPHVPASVDFWTAVVQRAEAALASGAMHSFACTLEFIEDGGVEFVMRRATNHPKGETAAGRAGNAARPPANPFLAPEPGLLVGALGETHLALLNKFSVVREHLLVVTRDFVDQRTLLDERDFGALAACMRDAEVLAFYNGGQAAGASQPHKHMQVVTLPLSPRHSVPMDAILGRTALPFRHAFARLADGDVGRPALMRDAYRRLLGEAGLRTEMRDGLEWQPEPYSLVLTHEWMLLVPRSRDKFEGISINSLAFAGSFFVRGAEQMQAIARAGPMSVLESVTLG